MFRFVCLLIFTLHVRSCNKKTKPASSCRFEPTRCERYFEHSSSFSQQSEPTKRIELLHHQHTDSTEFNATQRHAAQSNFPVFQLSRGQPIYTWAHSRWPVGTHRLSVTQQPLGLPQIQQRTASNVATTRQLISCGVALLFNAFSCCGCKLQASNPVAAAMVSST